MKINQVTIKAKLLILVAMMTTVLVISSIYQLSNFNIISQQAGDIQYRELLILKKANELKLSVIQVQQWLTDISATRGQDGLNDGFDEADKQAIKFQQLMNELANLDKGNSDLYLKLGPTFNDYYRVGKQMAAAYIESGPSGGNRMMDEFDAVVEKITTQVDDALAQASERTTNMLTTQESTIQNALISQWVIAVVLLTFLAIFFFSMSRAIGDLPVIVAELKRVADGDLTSTISLDRNDEIGDLSKSMQVMRSNLLGVITRILNTTEGLAAASSEMSAISSHTSESVTQQRNEIEQVAAAMSQMTATVHEISNSINQTGISRGCTQ